MLGWIFKMLRSAVIFGMVAAVAGKLVWPWLKRQAGKDTESPS